MPEKPHNRNEANQVFADHENVSAMSEDEVREAVWEHTRFLADNSEMFPQFVAFAKAEKLNGDFGFNIAHELVRFVVDSRFPSLPDQGQRSEMIEWIARLLYDDPAANACTERLWAKVTAAVNE